jgi:DNA-binding FadR family transcriptional regulator
MSKLITRKNLSEVVAEHLEAQIKAGLYKVNQKLPSEHELTKEFGVGRSSIREAIHKLENSGMVNVQQGLGTFVIAEKPVAESLSKLLQTAGDQHITEVRELLEIKIVEKAAQNRNEEDIRKIKSTLEKRKKAADQGKLLPWIEADIAFHLSIAAAAKNPVLTEVYTTFANEQLKKLILDKYSQQISMHRLTTLHNELVESIIEKQPARAIEITKAMHGN